MIGLFRIVFAALLAVAIAGPAMAQDRLSKRVTLDLKSMAPPEAFKVLADAVGLTAKVDPAVTRPVDILVRDVRARTALNTMCDSIGCAWSVSGQTLVVRPASTADMDLGFDIATTFKGEPRGKEGKARYAAMRPAREKVNRIMEAMKRTLPADMKFENVPLETLGQRVSEVLGIRFSISSDDPAVQTVSIDLSNRTLLVGLKDLMGPSGGHSVWTLRLGVEDGTGAKEPSVAIKLSTKGVKGKVPKKQ